MLIMGITMWWAVIAWPQTGGATVLGSFRNATQCRAISTWHRARGAKTGPCWNDGLGRGRRTWKFTLTGLGTHGNLTLIVDSLSQDRADCDAFRDAFTSEGHLLSTCWSD